MNASPPSPVSCRSPATSPRAQVLGPAARTHERAAFFWTIAVVGLGFLSLAHLGVLLCFGLEQGVPGWIAPAAFAAAAILSAVLVPPGEIGTTNWIIAVLTGELLVIASVAVAGAFFDFGWDGQWYHQNAVFQMARGWNPVVDPLHRLPGDVAMWLRHYAKGPWYIALALYQLTLDIECAKAATWIAAAASFACVMAAATESGAKPGRAAFLGALAALNPIVVCQVTTFLVDGLLASFLTCHAAALFAWVRRPNRLHAAMAIASAILCINAKQTGLVYVGLLTAGAGLWVLLHRRELAERILLLQVSAILLGVGVFGFNPYVTNAIHRGNPFYPWAGSAFHPGFDRPGQDPNDRFEIPRNLVDHNRLYRLAYSVFGRPGAQPLVGGPDARLMWPGNVGREDLLAFCHHGTRVSGFGPLFSVAIVVSGLLLVLTLVFGGWPRSMLLIVVGTLLMSLLIGPHGWWARYVPQLWWLPIAAMLAGLAVPGRRWIRWGAHALATVLLLNASLVAGVHLRWEIGATRTLARQLEFLRSQPGVRADLHYFSVAYGERLRVAGVRFKSCPVLHCSEPMQLMSVAPGYPGAVQVCIETEQDPPSSIHERP